MLDEAPLWTFSSDKPLSQWYDHVHLMPDHVVGQWLCLQRQSGDLMWQRSFRRPNTVRGIDSGIIVASETRSDGPWTADFGCYGISLESGALLWTAHGPGFRGRLARVLDCIPGVTNELRDVPRRVADGKVFCESGRVLDVRNGETVDRIPRSEVESMTDEPTSLARQLYQSSMHSDSRPVPIGHGLLLSLRQEEGEENGPRIVAETEDGKRAWQLSIREIGRYIDGNFFSYRLATPYLYLVVSEDPNYRPDPKAPGCVTPNPTRWQIMTVDVTTGKVVQDVSLSDDRIEECRIEDLDSKGLLIGKSSGELTCFTRRH